MEGRKRRRASASRTLSGYGSGVITYYLLRMYGVGLITN
jgi:hypothetical protein